MNNLYQGSKPSVRDARAMQAGSPRYGASCPESASHEGMLESTLLLGAHGSKVDSQGLAFLVEVTSLEAEGFGGVRHPVGVTL